MSKREIRELRESITELRRNVADMNRAISMLHAITMGGISGAAGVGLGLFMTILQRLSQLEKYYEEQAEELEKIKERREILALTRAELTRENYRTVVPG